MSTAGGHHDAAAVAPADTRGARREGGAADLSSASFDDLLREVLGRVHGALDERTRWQLLLDAVVSMGSDLSLDSLLSRIVEVTADLADAQYVALGVLGGGPGRRLRTFITHGLSDVQVQAIGPFPEGHGILGLIIDRPEPLRLHDIAEHPASYGFPANHPPMKSFLGVPVRVGEKVFGNLYLTEKIGGGDFTEQDQQIVVALAAAAGVAIENAQLAQEAVRRERWLAATAEITGMLSGSANGQDGLQLVADRARQVAEADVAWIVVGDEDDVRVRVVSGVEADPDELAEVSLASSVAREVVRSGDPTTIENFASDPPAVDLAAELGWPKLGPAIFVPMRGPAGVSGALVLAWTPNHEVAYRAVDAALPASFAEQAALALQVAQAREDYQRLALFEDRDRIGRDLHDLVIQRLFAIGLSLQAVARLSDRPEVNARLASAVDDLDATIKDIRRTIFALGSLENADDIQAEVTRMVDRAATTLKYRPALRFEGPVRTLVSPTLAADVLAVLQEALSNAARHSGATAVEVHLAASDRIRLTVSDNGRGLPAGVAESGLSNMRQRAERLGGECRVSSSPGAGTTVEWVVPVS